MLTHFLVCAATLLLVSFHASESAGSYPHSQTKKIQILVPHNIHHHTHTKYHFITIPAPRNRTDGTTTPRPVVLSLMPIVPLLPGAVVRNATPVTVPTSPQPTSPWQPTLPPAPLPSTPVPTNFQPSPQLPPGFSQPQQPSFVQPQPTQSNFPQTPPQAPPPTPLQQVRQPPPSSYAHNDYDYNYIDLTSRDSRNKIVRADPPQQTPLPPIKFKTIINVHETKNIPVPKLKDLTQLINKAYQEGRKIQLPKLFDFSRFIKPEPPKRYKIEVYPDKIQQIKQTQADTQRIISQWQELQETLKSHPYPGLKTEQLEFNPETAAYHYLPDPSAGQQEWTAVKQLLEKQIETDFPGLKINAEFKPVKAVYSEGPTSVAVSQVDTKTAASEEPKAVSTTAPKASLPDLKQIGYIIIGDNNQQHFVPFEEANDSSTT